MQICQEILKSFIRFEKPLALLFKELEICDYSKTLLNPVVQTRQDVISVLERYLRKEINNQDIQDWADVVFARDDVDYEKGYRDIIIDVLNYLGLEPNYGHPLTPDQAYELIKQLQTATYDIHEED